jgi:hypothetical protein
MPFSCIVSLDQHVLWLVAHIHVVSGVFRLRSRRHGDGSRVSADDWIRARTMDGGIGRR